MFKPNSLYYTDGYKVGHKRMLAKGTTKLYGSWIPRSIKHAPGGIKKIVSAGQQLTVRWLNDEFNENFFKLPLEEAKQFAKDMSLYLMQEYNGDHFEELHKLGYLPIRIKALPEGIETNPNIPHMTFINTVNGFAWLTLYLETIISSLAWKPSTSATIALQYRRNALEWVNKTDPDNLWLVDYMCHDFSARGLSPWDMLSSGLGHAMSHRGSDTVIVIPAARYFYNELKDSVCINSVNASEHSVSTTKIFTVGEKQMIIDWLKEFPTGILSIVADTFDLWKLLLEYIADPEVKALILARDGKLVIRPDSGDPVDIICGVNPEFGYLGKKDIAQNKGVIEILWDIFGGTTNKQGYKVLDSHIGCIYGDSINLDRQIQIYTRLVNKGFAATNIVLGVGSFTYQMNTRDTFGFAAKGAWFEICNEDLTDCYDIYKDPVTDDGTKKSLKGLLSVIEENGEIIVLQQCTWEQEGKGLLQIIFEDGKLYNQTTLTEIRERVQKL
jgi:nicotinamide phosphoribosyltransferase